MRDKTLEKLKILKELRAEPRWKKALWYELQKEEKTGFWVSKRVVLVGSLSFLVLSLLVLTQNSLNFLYLNKVSWERNQDLLRLEAELVRLQKGLELAQNSLQQVSEPQTLLALKESLHLTLRQGRTLTDSLKNEKNISLATRVEQLEQSLKAVEKTYLDKEKELALELIIDLENREMSPEQRKELERARDLWQKGLYEESLEILLNLK